LTDTTVVICFFRPKTGAAILTREPESTRIETSALA
jgi:hypothetical protein